MSNRYTQADLDALNKAIATGARSVSYNGHRVEYASLSDMRIVRAEMEQELGTVRKTKRSRATFSRGS